MNLAEKIEKQLPRELVEFMQAAGLVAASGGINLYLVGGVVRDLLLGRSNHDLDLVADGDAVNLSEQLTGIVQAEVTVHTRFRTHIPIEQLLNPSAYHREQVRLLHDSTAHNDPLRGDGEQIVHQPERQIPGLKRPGRMVR